MPRKHPGWFVLDARGTVSMEAENNDGLTAGTLYKNSWAPVNGEKGFSGSGVMQVPDRGRQISLQYSPDASPRMDFNVMFKKPGTYFLHVRGHGVNANGDSCHGGLDMQPLPELSTIATFPNRSGQYEWMSGKGFKVPHAGVHKINIWMREDGAMVDKIVISTSGQRPKDKGPAESLRGGGKPTMPTPRPQPKLKPKPKLKPVSKRTDESKARSQLLLAKSYIDSGSSKKAIDILKKIIVKYPKTYAAKTAEKELEAIDK
jgi:hypothetical protein